MAMSHIGPGNLSLRFLTSRERYGSFSGIMASTVLRTLGEKLDIVRR